METDKTVFSEAVSDKKDVIQDYKTKIDHVKENIKSKVTAKLDNEESPKPRPR